MKPMRTLAALLALATAASAQEKKEEKSIDWNKLQAGPVAGSKPGAFGPGTRVKVTLRNGNTLRGTVVHPDFLREVNPRNWRPKPLDFSKTDTVLLDIRLEQPELGGYVRLRRVDLRLPILELTPLDPAMLERLEAERRRIETEAEERLKQYDEWKTTRERDDEEARKRKEKEDATNKDVDEIEEKKRQLDKMKEALQVFDKFPEGSAEDQQNGKAWGAERLKAIQQKTKALVPLSAEEQEFMTSYDLWSLGKKIREEEKKKKEEEKKNP